MTSPLIEKIVLGTAQFGLDYGIANQQGRISSDEATRVLDLAWEAGIRLLDTAHAYGNSEKLIGEYQARTGRGFQVMSKLPALDGPHSSRPEAFLTETLNRLRQDRLFAYSAHRFDDLRSDPSVGDFFSQVRASRRAELVGVSLYAPQELDWLLDSGLDFNAVQVPCSVFDQRFVPHFPRLRKKGVKIFARSIFLQGLAFLSTADLPAALGGARKPLKELRDLADRIGVTVSSVCLNAVLAQEHLDGVVIGVDGFEHLRANLKCLEDFARVNDYRNEFETLCIADDDVLMPTRWRVAA